MRSLARPPSRHPAKRIRILAEPGYSRASAKRNPRKPISPKKILPRMGESAFGSTPVPNQALEEGGGFPARRSLSTEFSHLQIETFNFTPPVW